MHYRDCPYAESYMGGSWSEFSRLNLPVSTPGLPSIQSKTMNFSEASKTAAMIESIGEPDFGEKIDGLLSNSMPFDMSCIFLFSSKSVPVLIHDGYSESLSRKTLKAYLRGGYLLDPFYVACVKHHQPGIWRMEELAPDSFFTSDFVISKEIHPCVSTEKGYLSEEVGFIVPLNDELSAVYSLMRSSYSSRFSSDEIDRLTVLFPVVSSSIVFHCKNDAASKNITSSAEKENVEDAFVHAFDDRLTETQRLVVKMILRGHSSMSIANEMGISEGTVKLHRSNIYSRLNLSTQTELFRIFIDYLTSGGETDRDRKSTR